MTVPLLVQAAHFAADTSAQFLIKTYQNALWLGREIKKSCIENAHYVGHLFEKIIANAPFLLLMATASLDGRAAVYCMTYVGMMLAMNLAVREETMVRAFRAPILACLFDVCAIYMDIAQEAWQIPTIGPLFATTIVSYYVFGSIVGAIAVANV